MEQTHQDQTLPGPAAAEILKTDTDFDRSEPHALFIAGFGIASVIGLVVIILGIQMYFDHIREQAEYQKVAIPVAQDLKNIHAQEDEELNQYKYLDRKTGAVQVPISRAMELIAQEAATHKLKYYQKPTAVKVPGAPGEAGATPPANSAPTEGTQAAPGAAGGTVSNSSGTGSVGK